FIGIGPADLKTTASRFRYQGLQQKYIQFSTLWSKILKQIEEGTHHRDLFLLEKKSGAAVHENPSNISAEPKAPGSPKSLEILYEKMKQMVSGQETFPTKDKFVAAMQKQIDEQKKKNPNKKVEIKLQKDSKGKVQVRLSLKDRKSKPSA
ncbi:MAG: hypothetical protein JWQ35_637, partial [Bacteriovoracaceae bacterium]|nr:hypothetical protein [Bacteriovoracaceae bacterium]